MLRSRKKAATEASTIETINTILSGQSSEIGNHVDATFEDNASDLGNLAQMKVYIMICIMHDSSLPKIYFQITHVMKF